jgi:nucleoside-diphosphate-sugar epimerase
MRAENKRLPTVLPMGARFLDNLIQFVHVDDMARLIAYILKRSAPDPALTILNVAGRGPALTFRQCVAMSGNRLLRVPTRAVFRAVLGVMWKLGISGVPPEAAPYMTGTYVMDTGRLREFLGADYEDVIHYSNEGAFADTFKAGIIQQQSPAAPVHQPAAG